MEKENAGTEVAQAIKTELTAEYKQALAVHQHICECGKAAVNMIVEIGKSLKQIRDRKLFTALGYDTFKDYVERNGDYEFKERQAYTYIKLYEDNSTRFLEDNAKLGVTKLALLNQLAGYERQEFVEEHNLSGMTVKEIEQLIKEHQQRGEQLSFLQTELEQEKQSAGTKRTELSKQIEKLTADLIHQQAENSRLSAEVKAVKEKPVEVAVRELTDKELAAIEEEKRKEISAEYEKKLKAQQKKSNKKTAEIKRLKEKLDEKSAELEREKSKAETEREELEKKLKSGNVDEARTALKFYYQEVQKYVESFIEKINDLERQSDKEKWIAATVIWLRQMADILEEEDDDKQEDLPD